MMNDNAPLRGLTGDPGKGTLTIPPNNGELVSDTPYTEGQVRGDTKSFGEAGSNTGLNPGSPVWAEGRSLDGNATNSLGAFGDAKSDPMFEKFAREDRPGSAKNRTSGSEPAEGVASSGLSADSDPTYQELPNEQSEGPGSLKSQADSD